MMFRIIHGHYALVSSLFTLHYSNTQGHKFKLMKQFSRVNCHVFSFANRCIDVWNSLSDDAVCATSFFNIVFSVFMSNGFYRAT